ncbi:MAG: PAS domain S-box protein [Nodularia sp. (in: Bacteria)]|nr:MAG: PAS domain S-box protein [Nodularia sp. (in: cyanobacteria)]
MQDLPQLPLLRCLKSMIDFDPVKVDPETSISDAVLLMAHHGVNILVVSVSQVIGWLTQNDVMQLLASGVDLKTTTISEVMHAIKITLKLAEFKSMATVLSRLQQHKWDILPVIDEHGQLVGTVTPASICQALAKSDEETQGEYLQTPAARLRLLESAMLNVNDAILIAEADALEEPFDPRIVYVNAGFTKITGYTAAEVIGKTPRILQGELIDRNSLLVLNDLLSGKNFTTEFRIVRSSGEVRWISAKTLPVNHEKGEVYRFAGIAEDITELKQTQAALSQVNQELEMRVAERTIALTQVNQQLVSEITERQMSEERFRFLAESIPQQVWIAQANGELEYVNQRTINYFVCSSAQLLGVEWQQWIHPDDLSATLSRWQQSLTTGQPHEDEFRCLRGSDQTYRWHLIRALPMRNSQGKIVNWFGTNTDIDDHASTEIMLRKTQQQLQAILDNSPAVIYLVDTNGKNLLVNRKYEQLLNLTQDQIIGKSLYELWHDDIADVFAVNNHQVIADGVAIETEELVPHEDGLHTYLSIKFPLKNADGLPYAIGGISTDITQRKQTEEGLRLRNRAIAASSNGIIIADASLPNKPILYVNPAFERMTGYCAAEVIGRNFCSFPSADINQSGLQALSAAMQAGTDCTLTLRNYRKDGSLFWNELNVSPVYDLAGKLTHYIAIQTNITERKQAETALQVSQQRLQYLLSSSPAMIYSTTTSGDFGFTFISENITAMTGYEAWEIVENSSFWKTRIHPEDLLYVFAELSKVVETEHYTLEYRFLHKDGTYRWLYDQGKIGRDEAGNPLELVGYLADITERKQLEQELKLALETEKELHELKSRFISMTSHEFRTPLSTILSSSELLEHYRHKWTEEKQLTHLHRIQTAVQRMTEMLNDVLVIGKAEAGKLEYIPTFFDLVAYCRYLLSEAQVNQKNICMINFTSQHKSISCCMDGNLLGHILNNLLSNAIKYSPNQSTIKFTLSCQDEQAVFQIQDQGIGIPEEDLPRLFESFHRARNVGNILGTGLGLTIVKNCVDLHQGKISVISTLGVGTEFTVILPLNNHINIEVNND